jgi:hypothetical protein
VYLSADEFLDLERARLTLRAHGIGVDRGRLVREAIAVLMMDLETGIDASVVARRLRAADRPGPVSAARAVVNGAPADGAHGAQAASAFANDAPADGGLAAGDLHQGALTNGAPTAAALGTGGPVAGALADGGLVNGAPAGAQ